MSRRSSRHLSARTPKMPIGLIGLMEELSRDVLRNNPTELYSFCAEHMKKLLIIRDATKSKKVLTLEQKIALARTKVRERAAQRCEKYDKNMREIKNNESTHEAHLNSAQQQVLGENAIIIQQSDLEEILEPEIVGNEHNGKEKSEILIESLIGTEIDNSQLTDAVQCNNKDEDFDEGLGRKNIPTENEVMKEVQYSVGITEQDANKIDTEKNNVVRPICNEEFNANVDESKNNIPDSEVLGTEKGEILKEHDDSKHLDSTKIESDINQHPIENNTATSFDTIHDNKNENLQDPHRERDTKRIEGNELCTTTDVTVIENLKTDIEDTSLSIELELPNDKNNDETQNEKSRKLQNHASNNSMDLETAAITIQKVFRSFLFRNKTQSIEDATNVDINLLIEQKEKKFQDDCSPVNVNVNKDRRTLGANRMDTMLQTVNEEKSLSLSTDDSSTLSSAATIIQAHVRGFLVRNKFNNNNKTTSSTSGIDSDGQSFTSLEGDNDNRKNKTVLNIHIVPESGHFMSRDESMLTSIDLSLDGSPPSSSNLHPLGYDKTERRKQLKREDAIQSISPPSNNSGKLSEDVDSVKEILINPDKNDQCDNKPNVNESTFDKNISPMNTLNDENVSTVINSIEADAEKNVSFNHSMTLNSLGILSEMATDEMDVITPNVCLEENTTDVRDIKLIHSGECHDVVLPTQVSRNDTSVVREFQNVVVYFLLWNNS